MTACACPHKLLWGQAWQVIIENYRGLQEQQICWAACSNVFLPARLLGVGIIWDLESLASARQLCAAPSYINDHICCGNRYYDTPPQLEHLYTCCGDNLIKVDNTWECCGGKKMELNSDQQCCNNEIISSTLYQCCGHQKHLKQEGYECCRDDYHNSRYHTCCSTGNHSREGIGECCGSDTVYDPDTQICCSPTRSDPGHVHSVGKITVMLGQVTCCGSGRINTTTHVCCEDTPRPRNPHSLTECRGNETFDPSRQVMCGGILHDITDGKTECCGDQLINPHEKQCCGVYKGKETPLSPFLCCGEDQYDPANETCIDQLTQNFRYSLKLYPLPEVTDELWHQCGNKFYANTIDICCENQLSPRYQDSVCSDGVLYRQDSQFLLNGTVLDKISPDAQLHHASGLQYDPTHQELCLQPYNPALSQVFNGTDGRCCVVSSTEVKYINTTNESCCPVYPRFSPLFMFTAPPTETYQSVHRVPQAEAQCCGNEVLVPDQQLCDDQMQKVVNKSLNRPNDDDVCAPLDAKQRQEHPLHRYTYETAKEYCTPDGFIMPKQEGKGLCYNMVYDTTTQGCCFGEIYPRWSHQCCEGSVVQSFDMNQAAMHCCGGLAFNPNTHSCIHKSVESIPERYAMTAGGFNYDNRSFWYNGATGELLPRDARPGMKVCGDQKLVVYNEADHQCCGTELIGPGQTCCFGRAYDTPGTPLGGGECCGYTGINTATHKCCRNVVADIHGMVKPTCCVETAYDASMPDLMCCGGRLQRRNNEESQCTHGVMHTGDEIVCGGVRQPAGEGQCCGTAVFNSNTELCCEGFKYTKGKNNSCCGNLPYQNEAGNSELCCNGTLHKNVEGRKCCGHSLYDLARHECVTSGSKQYIYHDLDNQTNPFCKEGSYDRAEQTCCDGLLYYDVRECCGNKVIDNAEHHVCCGGSIMFTWDKDNSECCPSGQIIDKRFSTCEFPEQLLRHPLCNGTEYHPFIQSCCNNNVYNISEATCVNDIILHICGDQTYSKDNQTCCNNVLVDIPHGHCCGADGYDSESHVCCKGRLRQIREGRDQCCGARLFNPTREMCCVGNFKMPKSKRPKVKKSCCGTGFEPNFGTSRCEAIAQICRGLEKRSQWKEAVEDCRKGMTFEFTASHVATNATYTVVRVGDSNSLLLDGITNVDIHSIVLPPFTNCSNLVGGRSYVVLSAGIPEGDTLFLQEHDFLGQGQLSHKVSGKLRRRSCPRS